MSDDRQTGTGTATRTRVRPEKSVRSPRRYRVVLHNDDFTTMEFVIFVLEQFFGKSRSEATSLMLEVHVEGSCIAGRYSREVAETKVEEVSREAHRQGMPLLATAEPEEVSG